MTLDGARIYNENVGIGRDGEEKIRRIIKTIQAASKSSDLGLRLLKTGRMYEALLWGKSEDVPIGIYNRGRSINRVLDSLYKKIRKACANGSRGETAKMMRAKDKSFAHEPLPMAG